MSETACSLPRTPSALRRFLQQFREVQHSLSSVLLMRRLGGLPLADPGGDGLPLPERFARRFHSSIAGWAGRASLRLRLEPEAWFFRKVPGRSDPSEFVLAPLTDVFQNVLDALQDLRVQEALHEAALPYGLASAAGLARRLADQVQVELDWEFRPAQVAEIAEPDRWEGLDGLLLAPEVVAKQMTENVLGRIPGARTIRFTRTANGIRVRWLGEADREILTESLPEFVAAAAQDRLLEMGGKLARLDEKCARWARGGRSLLRAVHPRLAEFAEEGVGSRGEGELRVFAARHRGMATDAWLRLQTEPHCRDVGRCVLAVRRGHRGFVLESRMRRLFYFPPCILTARIACSPGRIRLLRPVVTQPRGGYVWGPHPYAGRMEAEYVTVTGSSASSCDPGPLPDISPEEAREFPSLENDRVVRPAATDICLEDQEAVLQRLSDRLFAQVQRGDEPDVLGAVRGAFDLARHGLTRAHQGNTLTPRVHLDDEVMRYPLRPRGLTGAFAERLFPYDPRKGARAMRKTRKSRRG